MKAYFDIIKDLKKEKEFTNKLKLHKKLEAFKKEHGITVVAGSCTKIYSFNREVGRVFARYENFKTNGEFKRLEDKYITLGVQCTKY